MAIPPHRLRADRPSRSRRGSPDRPVSGRIYRSSWALVAVPLLVAAFSVGRPEPLPAPELPPSFDGATAKQLAEDLAERYPDRAPGTPQSRAAADWVEQQLQGFGLTVERERFEAEIPGLGRQQLVNLIAVAPGGASERSLQRIVVMAHRDNLGRSQGANDNASGTAALLELARDLGNVSLAHTLVLVSTDGGAYGGLGAAALAASDSFRKDVIAVVNLDSLGGNGQGRIVIAGDTPRSPTAALAATASASVLAYTGRPGRFASAPAQLVDLAFPYSLYEQAPFLAEGISAITLTSAEDRPPSPETDVTTALNATRLASLGRSAQALVSSLDQAAEVARGTESYLYVGGRIVRGWAIAFTLLVALLPVLTATLDLLARLRRRRIPLAPALRAYRSRLGAWLWAGGLFALFAFAGIFPDGDARPLSPDTGAAQSWPLGALAALAGLSGLGWLVARSRLVPRRPVAREEELAGHVAAMIALCAVGLAVAFTNPYALLLVLPSLHAWLWLPHLRSSAPVARLGLFALGLGGPLAVLASLAFRYDLGLDAPWYLAELISLTYAPLPLALAFLAWGAAASQVAVVAAGRYSPYPPAADRPPRGPIRETVRQTVLLLRRLRETRAARTREDERHVAEE